MKNIIQTIILTLCIFSIYNLQAQEASKEKHYTNDLDRISFSLGTGLSKTSRDDLYLIALTHLRRLNQHFSIETKNSYKFGSFDFSRPSGIRTKPYLQIDIQSGVRYYLNKESKVIRPFVNAQLGIACLSNSIKYPSYFSEESRNQSISFIPNYNLGGGVEISDKIQFSLHQEWKSSYLKIACFF